jgi:uncharacterized protein DUF2332
MHGHDLGLSAAENYRAFAEDARGRSPVYELLATSVAEDPDILRFLGSLPPEKRQPNLLFAAARYLLGGRPGPGQLRELVSHDQAGLAKVMLARRTQTNEPARCATLLAALAQLPPPLALIEVGASAGLTLSGAGSAGGSAAAEDLGGGPAHLLQRYIAHMLGQAPAVPERIHDLAFPFTPVRIRERADHGRPALQSPGPDRVDVAGLQVKHS